MTKLTMRKYLENLDAKGYKVIPQEITIQDVLAIYEQVDDAKSEAELKRDNIWLDSAAAVHHITNHDIDGSVRWQAEVNAAQADHADLLATQNTL